MNSEKPDPSKKKKRQSRLVGKRIAVTEETRNWFSEFAKVLGLTQEEALNYILDKHRVDGDTAKKAALRLRADAGRWKFGNGIPDVEISGGDEGGDERK